MPTTTRLLIITAALLASSLAVAQPHTFLPGACPSRFVYGALHHSKLLRWQRPTATSAGFVDVATLGGPQLSMFKFQTTCAAANFDLAFDAAVSFAVPGDYQPIARADGIVAIGHENTGDSVVRVNVTATNSVMLRTSLPLIGAPDTSSQDQWALYQRGRAFIDVYSGALAPVQVDAISVPWDPAVEMIESLALSANLVAATTAAYAYGASSTRSVYVLDRSVGAWERVFSTDVPTQVAAGLSAVVFAGTDSTGSHLWYAEPGRRAAILFESPATGFEYGSPVASEDFVVFQVKGTANAPLNKTSVVVFDLSTLHLSSDHCETTDGSAFQPVGASVYVSAAQVNSHGRSFIGYSIRDTTDRRLLFWQVACY